MIAGIDVGSTGVKVSLFSPEGERLHYAYREYDLCYAGRQVTLDPAIWWACLRDCLMELSQQCELCGLHAIGISHANAMVLADEALRTPFGAIMQLDRRGTEVVSQISADLGEDAIFRRTGNRNAAGFVWGPTLKWLARNRAEEYARMRFVLHPGSYLGLRLTGAYYMDHTRAATTMLYDMEKGQWDKELCAYFALPMENMPALHCSGQVIGRTLSLPELALPGGVPVVAGAMDTVAAMVGLASGRQENVLILGSVGRFAVATRKLDRRFLNTVTPDRSGKLCMTPVNNAGIAVRWIRNILFSDRPGDASFYDRLDSIAEKTEPGADGLAFFPYLTGSACPSWDDQMRGAFLGLEAFHEAGHYARAVLEGVGFALAENLRILEQEVGVDAVRLFVGGGGAKSQVWLQILSDILGKELIIPKHLETETIGSALLAGLGAGVVREEQVSSWNQPVGIVSPSLENHRLYNRLLDRYLLLCQPLCAVRDIMAAHPCK